MPKLKWSDIDGYFSYQDFYDKIFDWLKPNDTFVEVGSLLGRSIAYVATRSKQEKKPLQFVSIDHGVLDVHLKRSKRWTRLKTTTGEFIENLRGCRVLSLVTHIVGDSAKSASFFQDDQVAFCYIDACHTYEAVRRDVEAWIPKIKLGGILSGHDYLKSEFGVKQAVDEIFGTDCHAREYAGGVWAVVRTEAGFVPLSSLPEYLN